VSDPSLDAVIPARNEASTVGPIVYTLKSHPLVRSVIVVDNGSDDVTANVAAEAGAIVVSCPVRGLGRAVKAGIRRAKSDFILKTDADIRNWDAAWVDLLLPQSEQVLTRMVFDSPYDTFPVTRLVAEPLLRRWRRDEPPPRPLSGTYSFHRLLFDEEVLSDDWSFDVSLLCNALERSLEISNVHVGMMQDRQRGIDHYVPMAGEILEFFLSRYLRELKHDSMD
jgi:glycosyltransferase involved in cell wall biosynthesis